jgi:Fe-S-cluster containining protein
LIVQAEWIDVVREPQMKDADRHYQGQNIDKVLELLEDGMRVVTLACGQACPILSAEKTCSIYPTRPNDCVAMQAGDEQCQQARAETGLPPLLSLEEQQQAKYRQEYIRQLRLRECPDCGDTGTFWPRYAKRTAGADVARESQRQHLV